MTEVWKPIVGFPGYEVSDAGRIKSFRRNIQGKILKPYITGPRKNYLEVMLGRDGCLVRRKVHRLVLETFVGPCPTNYEAGHMDGNSMNNHVNNLAWITPSENIRMKFEHIRAKTGVRPKGKV